jgi:multisubunit Na+/H+ antiporter MnhB subunit
VKSYEKSSFTAMVMGTVSGVLFAVGMCIALLQEWGAFNRGIMTGCCFFLLSFLLIVTVRKMNWIFPYRCSKISTETRTELISLPTRERLQSTGNKYGNI